MTTSPIRCALLSVSDKTGLADFARQLAAQGTELIASGGTAAHLRDAGLAVTDIARVTASPAMLDGRVKTLHPNIHAGILARRDDAAHMETLEAQGIPPIDLVAVNLYPFEAALAAGEADRAELVEHIDVGGPSLIRAAAKAHEAVTVLTDPGQYATVRAALAAGDGSVAPDLRRRLAAAAFTRLSAYDATIAGWLTGSEPDWPTQYPLVATDAQVLRYGENPHQGAALYATPPARPGIASASHLQGSEPGWNNIHDGDGALKLVADLDGPAAVIVKHATPCGVALADSPAEAFARALACDRQAAFGGVASLNRPIDADLAGRLLSPFLELVLAPGVTEDAAAILADKPRLRVLIVDPLPARHAGTHELRSVTGGLLVQEADGHDTPPSEWRCVTSRIPSPQEQDDLQLAWVVARHARSNAVTLVRGGALAGIGAGQTSRVAGAEQAAAQVSRQEGAAEAPLVAASDAFFPFPDGLQACIAAGAIAIVQPGGAKQDEEVVEAAEAAGVSLLLTGHRHFRH